MECNLLMNGQSFEKENILVLAIGGIQMSCQPFLNPREHVVSEHNCRKIEMCKMRLQPRLPEA